MSGESYRIFKSKKEAQAALEKYFGKLSIPKEKIEELMVEQGELYLVSPEAVQELIYKHLLAIAESSGHEVIDLSGRKKE